MKKENGNEKNMFIIGLARHSSIYGYTFIFSLEYKSKTTSQKTRMYNGTKGAFVD